MSLPARVSFVVALLVLAPAGAPAQTNPTDSNQRLIDALRAFIPEVMRQDGTPGLNIALARGGKIVWEEQSEHPV